MAAPRAHSGLVPTSTIAAARRTLPAPLVDELDAIVAEGTALLQVRDAPDRRRAWSARIESFLLDRLGLPEDQPRAETLTAEQRAAVVLLSTDDALRLPRPLPTSALARRRWIGLAPPSIFEEDVDGEPRWLRYQRLWQENRKAEIGSELASERRFEWVLERERGAYAGRPLADAELAAVIAAATPLAAWVRAQDLSACTLSTVITGAMLAVAISDGAELPPSFDALVDVEGMGSVDPIAILRAIPDARREAVILANLARWPTMTLRIASRVLPIFDLPRVAEAVAALGSKPPRGLDAFDKTVWAERRDVLLSLVDRYPVLGALAPRGPKPPGRTPPARGLAASADPLHDPDAFEALSAPARAALAASLGEVLGGELTVSVGAMGTIDVVIPGVATTFHLVPGGSMQIGITAHDLATLEGTGSARALAVAREREHQAVPVREVTIAPFLVSDAIAGVDARTRAAALACAPRAKLRLPSEVELEYLLREGRSEQVFALQNADGDGPDEHGSDGRAHRWGLVRALDACWAADDWHHDYRGAPASAEPWGGGSDEGVVRSGFGVGLSQGGDELVFALAGLRTRGTELGDLEPRVRLVRDLPLLTSTPEV